MVVSRSLGNSSQTSEKNQELSSSLSGSPNTPINGVSGCKWLLGKQSRALSTEAYLPPGSPSLPRHSPGHIAHEKRHASATHHYEQWDISDS